MNKFLTKIAKDSSSAKEETTQKVEFKTRPHHLRALEKLEQTGGLLADHSMGSGKTSLYLQAINRYQAKNPGKKTLFIAPASLTTNFDKEHAKHGIELDRSKVDVLSYEMAANKSQHLRKERYGQVIVDEAHKMRSTGTKRSQELSEIIENADQRLLGTGTIAFNQVSDVAPLVNLAAGHVVLPVGKKAFEEAFVEDKTDSDVRLQKVLSNPKFKKLQSTPLLQRILGASPKEVHVLKNKKALSNILNKYVDRYDLSEDPSAADKFPTKTEKVVEVEMSPSQQALYKYLEGKLPWHLRMKVRMNLPLDKKETANLQAFSSGVRQVSNSTKPWMQKYESSTPKIKAAVDSIAKGHKEDKNFRGVIYSNYLDAGLNDYSEELTKRGIPHQVFTGAVSKGKKDEMIENYNSGKSKVLLISSSGAEGLNLKGTKKVQILEPHFNQSKINQVIGRGVRFESHSHLPAAERKVEVEHYLSVLPKSKFSFGPKQHSIDQYLRHNAKTKSDIGSELTGLIKDKDSNPLIKKAFELAQHSFTRAKYREDMDWTKLTDPVASIKRDGAAFFLKIGPDGSPQYLSRRESVKGGFPDRTPQLGELSNVKVPEYAGDVYHVELVHTGKDNGLGDLDSHARVSGILNSLPERALATQRVLGPVRAILIDVIEPKLPTYGEKIRRMQEFSQSFNRPEIMQTPSIKIGRTEIEKLISSTKQAGHEGVIITSLTAPESTNIRVKVKHVDTYNLRVVGVTQEVDIQGNYKDSLGSFIVEDATERVVAKVGTGFSREDRIEFWKNRDSWIGKLIQVKAMPTTAHKLRAPVYNGIADGDIDKV